MATALLDTTRNLSFYTIPLAWVLCLGPHMYAVSLHDAKSAKKFDNTSPRTLIPSLDKNQGLDDATKQTIVRAEAAQQNGFENIGLFAAAVVAANVANVDSWWINALSGGYLVSRTAYNVCYIQGVGNARTAAFLSGVGIIFTLFIQSGNAVRNAVL